MERVHVLNLLTTIVSPTPAILAISTLLKVVEKSFGAQLSGQGLSRSAWLPAVVARAPAFFVVPVLCGTFSAFCSCWRMDFIFSAAPRAFVFIPGLWIAHDTNLDT